MEVKEIIMLMEVILSILGVLCLLALGINGYFLRGIFKDLNTVNVQLATSLERGIAKENRLDKIEVNEKETFKRLNELERKVG